jgi:hypothetical protein
MENLCNVESIHAKLASWLTGVTGGFFSAKQGWLL